VYLSLGSRLATKPHTGHTCTPLRLKSAPPSRASIKPISEFERNQPCSYKFLNRLPSTISVSLWSVVLQRLHAYFNFSLLAGAVVLMSILQMCMLILRTQYAICDFCCHIHLHKVTFLCSTFWPWSFTMRLWAFVAFVFRIKYIPTLFTVVVINCLVFCVKYLYAYSAKFFKGFHTFISL
jgi:hypothetical protein